MKKFMTRFHLAMLAAMVCLTGSLFAASVDSATASLFVGNWLKAANNPVVADGVARTLTDPIAIAAPESGEVLAYAFNLKPYGFVVVAADTLINPVVVSSDGGQYDPDPRNPLVSLVISDLLERKAAVENEFRAPGQDEYYAANEDAWAKYTSETRSRAAYILQEIWVDKLMDVEWSQSTAGDLGPVYNYYTPNVSESGAISWDKPGDPRNAVSGCVATATAQAVQFFRWPQEAVGNKSNTVTVGGSENIVGATYSYKRRMRGGDGSGGAYDWDKIINCPGVGTNDPRYQEVSDENIQAIGALLYDAGVAVGMHYYSTNSGESGANFSTGAMTNYFKFGGASSGITFQQARASLDAHRPVLITISGFALYTPPGASSGHAIVGDGYGRIDGRWYYHLNLGWGTFWPGANAWYNIDDFFTPNNSIYQSAGVSVGNLYRQKLQANDNLSGKIIAGRVTDANGNPVAGVKVSISKEGSSAVWQSMLVWNETLDGSDPYEVKSAVAADEVCDHFRNYTDANGIWFVDKVAPGSYTVNLEKEGYAFQGDTSVTVAGSNQWGIGFVAVPEAIGALELESWWIDGGILFLQFNRAVGDVMVDPSCITVGGTNLGNCAVNAAADSAIIQINVSSLSLSGNLTMTAGALYYDVDGASDEAGAYDLPLVKVAPAVADQASGSAAETCTVTAITRNGNDFTTSEDELEFKFEGSGLSDITLSDLKLNVTATYDGDDGLYSRVQGSKLPSVAIGNWDASAGILTVNVGKGYGFVRVDYVPVDGSTPFVAGETYRVNKQAPAIISATLAADNSYVDITFSKPVGGATEIVSQAGIQASADGANYFYTGTLDAASEFSLWRKGAVATADSQYNAAIDGEALIGSNAIAEGQAASGVFPTTLSLKFGALSFEFAKLKWADVNGDGEFTAGTDGIFIKIADEVKNGDYAGLIGGATYSDDDLFVLGEGTFADQNFWLSNSAVLDPNNSEGSCPAFDLSALPATLSYYSADGAFPNPIEFAGIDDASVEAGLNTLYTYLNNLQTGAGNGAWLDYSADTSATFVAGQDEVILGATPEDATAGTAISDELYYLDVDGSGFMSTDDFVWMDSGDGAWTKEATSGDTLVGKVQPAALNWREPVTMEDFYVTLHQNGGTVTDAHVDSVTDKAGNPLSGAVTTIRAWLAFEPATTLHALTLPVSDNDVSTMNVPAGVETIEVHPYANSVYDADGNAVPKEASTGELVLFSSGNPFIVDASMAGDNYSVAIRFSERIYPRNSGLAAADLKELVAEDGVDSVTWAAASDDIRESTRNFSANCVTATVIYNDSTEEELQLTQRGENRAIRYKTGTAFLVIDFATQLDLSTNIPLLDPVYQNIANGRFPVAVKITLNNVTDVDGFPLAFNEISLGMSQQYSGSPVTPSLPPPMFTNANDAYTFITAADQGIINKGYYVLQSEEATYEETIDSAVRTLQPAQLVYSVYNDSQKIYVEDAISGVYTYAYSTPTQKATAWDEDGNPTAFTDVYNHYYTFKPTERGVDTTAGTDGLEYYGIYYRDLDADGRIDAIDLNFHNPWFDGANKYYATLRAGSSAASNFFVYVKNGYDETKDGSWGGFPSWDSYPLTQATDSAIHALLENSGYAVNNWSRVNVTGVEVVQQNVNQEIYGMPALSGDYCYSTLRVTIDQTQVAP
ncbi:MAG: C10 family peptidase [Victivallales bacterium]|nr:C10 family peptidase [Victivallales bacterium]